MIGCMYAARIVDASALVPRLRFEISGVERRLARSKTRAHYAQLFVRAVHRYVNGPGHPDHILVTEFQTLNQSEVPDEHGRAETRPHLLLAAFTESTQLPRDDLRWTLKVGDLFASSPFERSLLTVLIQFIMEDPAIPGAEASAPHRQSLSVQHTNRSFLSARHEMDLLLVLREGADGY